MLDRVKTALRVGTTVYDQELLGLIAAGIADIRHAGARFDATEVRTSGTVKDYTIEDPLVADAVITYCKLYFGSSEDFDRLKAAYDEKKGQLRESSDYGMIDVSQEVIW